MYSNTFFLIDYLRQTLTVIDCVYYITKRKEKNELKFILNYYFLLLESAKKFSKKTNLACRTTKFSEIQQIAFNCERYDQNENHEKRFNSICSNTKRKNGVSHYSQVLNTKTHTHVHKCEQNKKDGIKR